MIYLITGVPGSGKTLYAVSTLVQKLAAEKLVKGGKTIERRVCVDGIPDLVIPHEKMDPGIESEDGVTRLPGEGNGIWNWPDWCMPGDVIVVDEVQRWWRPRAMGSKPSRDVKALETHRHMGVDFVIITQNPMLLDQNVRRLIGRHQHIRRLFGMQRAIIYDWDSCSMDVSRVKSATTSFFNYPKSAYALYKSAELHTKPKQKLPIWLAVPVLAVAGMFAVAPSAFGTLYGAMSGKGVGKSQPTAVAASAPSPGALPAVPGTLTPAKPWKPEPVEQVIDPAKPADVSVAQQTPLGCIAMAERCTCYSQTGAIVKMPIEACQDGAKTTGFVLPAGSTVPTTSPKDGVALATRY